MPTPLRDTALTLGGVGAIAVALFFLKANLVERGNDALFTQACRQAVETAGRQAGTPLIARDRTREVMLLSGLPAPASFAMTSMDGRMSKFIVAEQRDVERTGQLVLCEPAERVHLSALLAGNPWTAFVTVGPPIPVPTEFEERLRIQERSWIRRSHACARQAVRIQREPLRYHRGLARFHGRPHLPASPGVT